MEQPSPPPSASGHIAEAARHLAAGKIDAVLATLGAAGARDATDPRLHFLMALAAWQLRDIARALTLTQSCFDRDPSNGTLAEVLASLYAQSGELLDSLFYGKLATALAPDPVMHGWIPPGFPSFGQAFLSIQDKPLLAQSRLLLAGGKRTQALEKARQHVQVAPRDDEGRQLYAELLLHAGRAALAAETLWPLTQGGVPGPSAASLMARSLAVIGEAEAAARWHENACAAAPERAEIGAARIADAPWLGVAQKERDGWIETWLGRFTRPSQAKRLRAAGSALVVGYLVPHLVDRGDAVAIAAVARALRQRGVTVVGYGLGAQSSADNTLLRGAFDKWRDITGVDQATLAKVLAGDGLHVAIDACGFAAPDALRALARLNTALRVAWIVDPSGLEGRIYDAAIAAGPAASGGSIAFWRPRGGFYPLLRDWTRQRDRVADGACRFGADVHPAQIDGATAALWRRVLAAAPQAMLLLRADSLDIDANLSRLIARFGDAAARIDIVAVPDADEFYRQVDVALAPLRGTSPRMAAEALGCGVPVLALDAGGEWQPPYAALLRELGLAELVAATPEAYAALAAGLAISAEKRSRAAASVAPIAARGEETAALIAATIEDAARAALGRAAA